MQACVSSVDAAAFFSAAAIVSTRLAAKAVLV